MQDFTDEQREKKRLAKARDYQLMKANPARAEKRRVAKARSNARNRATINAQKRKYRAAMPLEAKRESKSRNRYKQFAGAHRLLVALEQELKQRLTEAEKQEKKKARQRARK